MASSATRTAERQSVATTAPDPPDSPFSQTDPSGLNADRSDEAIRTIQQACALEEAPYDPSERVPRGVSVRRLTGVAEALLEPGWIVSAAGEAVPQIGSREPFDASRQALVDTLESPNSIGVRASEQRLELLNDVGLLQVGVDAAQSVRASNSIERMIAHEIAGGHTAAMKLLGFVPGLQGRDAKREQVPITEVARVANAVARLMEATGTLSVALMKLKSRGRQHVVVQHQQLVMTQNGPGVVMNARRRRPRKGSRPRGRRSKNA